MDFNIHQDHLIIELDEKINSYRNQIEKIKWKTQKNQLKKK